MDYKYKRRLAAEKKAAQGESSPFRDRERSSDSARRRITRQDSGSRSREQSKDTKRRRLKREDSETRSREQSQNTQRRRLTRQNSGSRSREQSKDTERRRLTREDSETRIREQSKDTERRHNARENPEVREREHLQRAVRKAVRDESISHLELLFEQKKLEGPTCICSCCLGLRFPSSISKTTPKIVGDKYLLKNPDITAAKSFVKEVLQKTDSNNSHLLCNTCRASIYNGNVPYKAASKGFALPEVPPEVQILNSMEETLVALAIPFWYVRRLGCDRQFGIHGSMVTVPADVTKIMKFLPNKISEHHNICVQLERRLGREKYNLFDGTCFVSKSKIEAALNKLLTTPLYVEANLPSLQSIDPISAFSEMESPTDQENTVKYDDSLEKIPIFTMAIPKIHIAPAESHVPQGFIDDKNILQACPTIYAGQRVNYPPKATISEKERSGLRYFTRQHGKNITRIFLGALRIIQNKLQSSISISFRMGRQSVTSAKLTAKDVDTEDKITSLVSKNEAYKLTSNIQGSPSYLHELAKKGCAMIRQLGAPTFFLTLSANEHGWDELLNILKNVNQNETQSGMKNATNSYLISSDPVTCSQYFDKRFRAFLNGVLKKKGGPFSPFLIRDYHFRIEFQKRGSPHAHGLIWLANAPQYGKDSEQIVTSFIDDFISTSGKTADSKLEPSLTGQKHTCGAHCLRGDKRESKCRFNFPKYPMISTMVLHPLSKEGEEEKLQYGEQYLTPKKVMASLKEKINVLDHQIHHAKKPTKLSYEEFLDFLAVDHQVYIKALRSTLSKKEIFYSREVDDMRVNCYNDIILRMWHANMDIQYILDPLAALTYIVKYMTKVDKGMSALLKKANDDILGARNLTSDSTHPLKKRLRNFSNKLMNTLEISAQEAVYMSLGLAFSHSSRSVVYVNSISPNKRDRLLKPLGERQKLHPDSTDIFVDGMNEHYLNRSSLLEMMCLAEVSTRFTYVKSISKSSEIQLAPFKTKNDDEDLDNASDDDEDHDLDYNDGSIRPGKNFRARIFECGKGFLKQHFRMKIARFPYINKEKNEKEWKISQLIAYAVHNKTQLDYFLANTEKAYEERLQEINENRIKFDPYKVEEFIEEMHQQVREEESLDIVEPSYPDADWYEEVNNFDEPNKKPKKKSDGIPLIIGRPLNTTDEVVQNAVQKLSAEQRRIFYDIISRIKNDRTPFYECILGQAGCGKSTLIHAISLYATKIFNIKKQNTSNPKILLVAPTGIAAYNIGGYTIHSAFSIRPKEILRPLGDSKLGDLKEQFQDIELIIVDEISMVGSRLFLDMEARLREIFNTPNIPFGDKSVLVFGDFLQLSPVGDTFVFHYKDENQNPIVPQHWSIFDLRELDQVFRQRDPTFLTALRELGKSELSPESTDFILSLVDHDNEYKYATDTFTYTTDAKMSKSIIGS